MNYLQKIREKIGFNQPKKSQNLTSQKKVRILYQQLTERGAFGYIDRGYIHGYQLAGADVVSWNSKNNSPNLAKILQKFKPTHFIGYFQESGAYQRRLSNWTEPELLKLLLTYKQKHGLKVAIRANPSHLQELFLNTSIETLNWSNYKQMGVENFYNSSDKFAEIKEKILDTELVDLIRSPLYHGVYNTCFRDYIDFGLPILEEPHAADLATYNNDQEVPKTIDILYIGGCWTFKWENMKPYITQLKSKFDHKLKIYGKGWEEGYSLGMLEEKQYNQTIKSAKINLSFHEPSQVLNFPFGGNERIFKILALNGFVISDANPLLNYHFKVPEEIEIAKSPEHMIELIQYYLERDYLITKIANQGYQRVLSEHTYEYRASRLLELLNHSIEQPINLYRKSQQQ